MSLIMSTTPHSVRGRADQGESSGAAAEQVLATARSGGVSLVPHVAGRVSAAHGADIDAAVRCAQALTPQQRSGMRMLPQTISHTDATLRAFFAVRARAHRARGAERARALAWAGEIALGEGCLEDAADCFGEVVARGDENDRADITSGLVLAAFLRDGAVSSACVVETGRRPRAQRHAQCRAAALRVVLSAVRGDRAQARTGLARLGTVFAAEPDLHALRDLTTAWVWFLLGDPVHEHTGGGDPAQVILDALRAGVTGDPARGIRALSPSDMNRATPDPTLGRWGSTSLLHAHRTVGRSLLWTWHGDLAAAYRELSDAAFCHPVALAFGGLGLALMRRLEIALTGDVGHLSAALSVGQGSDIHQDVHGDRAMRAYLAGDTEEAALQLALWHDRGAPRMSLGIPLLDETGPLDVPPAVEPADTSLARDLRRQVRGAGDGNLDAIADAGRGIRSPFERGRLEALLGTAHLRRQRPDAAHGHFRRAQTLFVEAGAPAWERAVWRRMQVAGAGTADRSAAGAAPPLAVCRAEWEALLTARELQIVMLMAEGVGNREIAQRLRISVRTVEVHSRSLFAKLGVRTRLELVILAFRTDRFG